MKCSFHTAWCRIHNLPNIMSSMVKKNMHMVYDDKCTQIPDEGCFILHSKDTSIKSISSHQQCYIIFRAFEPRVPELPCSDSDTGGNSEVSDTDSENVLSLHNKVSGTFFWARSRIGIRMICLSVHQKKMSVTFF